MATGLWLKFDHAQTSTAVTLSAGTGVIGATAYHVTDVDLGVAAPLLAGISRRGNYTPVSCSVTCTIVGATADAVWAALDGLYKIMSIAALWASGKAGIDPVLIRFSPPGSTTTIGVAGSDLTAVMLRPINGGVQVDVSRPMRSSANGGYELKGVKITFERQGEWQYVFTPGSGSERVYGTATATNATIQLLSMSAVTPQHVRMGAGVSLNVGTNANTFNGLVAMSGNVNAIAISEFTYASAPFSAVSDGLLPKRGTGQVSRFTPVSTAGTILPGTLGVVNVTRPIFILSARNNSSSYQYRVRVRISSPTATSGYIYTPWRVIDGSTTNARLVVFPAIGHIYNYSTTADVEVAASAVGGTCDFNFLAMVDSAEYTAQVFRFGDARDQMVIRSPLINDDREMAAWREGYANDYNATERTASTYRLNVLSGAPPFLATDGAYVLAMVHSGQYWAQRTAANALDTIQYGLMRRRMTVTPR